MCFEFRRRRSASALCDTILDPEEDQGGFGSFGPNFGCNNFNGQVFKLKNYEIFDNEDSFALPCQNNLIDFDLSDNKYCFKMEQGNNIEQCGTTIQKCECSCSSLSRRRRQQPNTAVVLAGNANANAHLANALSCDWSNEEEPPFVSSFDAPSPRFRDKYILIVSISLSATLLFGTIVCALPSPLHNDNEVLASNVPWF